MTRRFIHMVGLVLAAAAILAPESFAQNTEEITIHWYAPGDSQDFIEAQNQLIEQFNAENPGVHVINAPNSSIPLYDFMDTSIANGEAPDLIGPWSYPLVAHYEEILLDLTPYREASDLDSADFPSKILDYYRFADGHLGALPFALYPSVLFYNTALFDAAGVPYPPHEWGAAYADGDAWDMAKLREVAMQLTFDTNGKNALDPDFDSSAIQQYGFLMQWTDTREDATLFGAGHLIDTEGDVTIPADWQSAFQWMNDAVRQDYFMPPADQYSATSEFHDEAVAMAYTHSWYLCCVGMNGLKTWDIAALPAYDGQITAPIHTDALFITSQAEHPDVVFQFLEYLYQEGGLAFFSAFTDNGLPAYQAYQTEYIVQLEQRYPGIDWQVALDSLEYVPSVTHELRLPNHQTAINRLTVFFDLYRSANPDVTLESEITLLEQDLEAVFSEG